MVIKRKKWGGIGYPEVKMLGSIDFTGAYANLASRGLDTTEREKEEQK